MEVCSDFIPVVVDRFLVLDLFGWRSWFQGFNMFLFFLQLWLIGSANIENFFPKSFWCKFSTVKIFDFAQLKMATRICKRNP